MPIYATSSGSQKRETVPAANHVARCYQMIEIGTIEDNFQGEVKMLHKVRLTFELPFETRVFKEENGEQPMSISKEFTLSMHEKSTLRQMLQSWRGKAFTEAEAKKFDVAVLVGVPCMLNIIHKPKKDGEITAVISSITPLAKGTICPPQVNPSRVLSFDSFDWNLFNSLPDFLKDKIKSSEQFRDLVAPEQNHDADRDLIELGYQALTNPGATHDGSPELAGVLATTESDDDLPF